MRVVIIKYNAGNVQSVTYALNRLGVVPLISNEPEVIKSADYVIFPGVGEASTAMRYLKERNLDRLIKDLKQPVFGVCLGLQLMCNHSEENNTNCLGIFDVAVKRFPKDLKVPQMGWNTIEERSSPLFDGLPPEAYVYYVHSFYAEISTSTIAQTNYILPFSAALQKTIFMPCRPTQRKGKVGEHILKNF